MFQKSLRSTAATVAIMLLATLVGLVGAGAPTADAQETSGSHFALDGTAGDFITQGNDVYYEANDDVTFIPSINFDNGVNIMLDVYNGATFVTRWHANFAAPNEVPLAAGDAFTATRFPFQPADTAGLSIFGAGRGCNQLTGDFVINELATADGEVELFDADFTQSCDGGAAMTGSVRFASVVEPPADTTPPEATAGLDQTGRTKRGGANFFVQASCTDNEPGVEMVSAEINGTEVADGQKVRLVISNKVRTTLRKGKLTIEAPSIELVVNCVDAAGNTASASTNPVYD